MEFNISVHRFLEIGYLELLSLIKSDYYTSSLKCITVLKHEKALPLVLRNLLVIKIQVKFLYKTHMNFWKGTFFLVYISKNVTLTWRQCYVSTVSVAIEALQLREILRSDKTLFTNLAAIVHILLSSDSLANKIAERLEEKVTNSYQSLHDGRRWHESYYWGAQAKITKLSRHQNRWVGALLQELIYGAPEHLREDTNDIVIDTVPQYLNVHIVYRDYDLLLSSALIIYFWKSK